MIGISKESRDKQAQKDNAIRVAQVAARAEKKAAHEARLADEAEWDAALAEEDEESPRFEPGGGG